MWEGRAHCGLDDAKNTARLLTRLMHCGFRFTITDSLTCQSADCSLAMQQFPDRRFGFSQQSFGVKHPTLPLIRIHPIQVDPSKVQGMLCYCGVKSSKQMLWKPGSKPRSCFFGCGNWTATGGAQCSYFVWATA